MRHIQTMRRLRRLLMMVCTAVAMAPTLGWAGIDPTPWRSGLFGVMPGQAIRISVLNAGDAPGTMTPRVKVWDAGGKLLFDRIGRTLSPGHGLFVDFVPGGDESGVGTSLPGIAAAGRAQLRAEVSIEYAPLGDGGQLVGDEASLRAMRRNTRLTLEVFDLPSGRTVYTLPLDEVSFNPQPEPPEPLVAR